MKARLMMAAIAVTWITAGLPSLLSAADREEAQFNVAVSLYNAGQWQAALNHITAREQQTIADAMRARYAYVRGLCHERGNQVDAAHAAYTALIQKFPQAPETAKARVALIYLDYAKGNNDAVIAGFGQINLNALDAAGKRNLTLMCAEAYLAKKDDARAIQTFTQAIALGAEAAQITPKLFDLYLRAGNHAQLLAVSNGGVPGADAGLVALARAEAFLTLNQPAGAEPEAAKVPANHAQYPRAAYARARALIALKRQKEAIPSLEVAVAKLDSPPVRAAASLVLVECHIEAANPAGADAALAQARQLVAALPPAEQTPFAGHLALVDLRLAGAGQDPKRVAEAVARARDHLPPNKLPEALYMRLYALSQQKDNPAVLATMAADFPILQKGDQDAQASFIYYKALKSANRQDEAAAVLNGLIQRRGASKDALDAHLVLANDALAGQAYDKAGPHLAAIVARADAKQLLAPRIYQEVLCNRGVVALKAGDAAAAIDALGKAIAEKPEKDLLQRSLQMLGQAHFDKKDYPAAATAWEQSLTHAEAAERPSLHDRLARVYFVAGNHPAVSKQFAALAELKQGAPLEKDQLAMWARSLFTQKQFAESAAKYTLLYDHHGKTAEQAYEIAVAMESAGQTAESAKWFGVALAGVGTLPPAYAQAVAANQAGALLRSKSGDMGRGFWLSRLVADQPDDVFDGAVTALVDIINAGKADPALAQSLGEALGIYSVDHVRRYSIGAVLLHALAATDGDKQLAQQAATLVETLAEHETKLDSKKFGASVGAAMIHYYAGEGARRAGRYADALAAYETVLGVYPYNEWPDAAAYGAAQCFAAFGDKETAISRLKEIAGAKPATPASQKWQEKSTQLITTLEKGE